MDKLLPGRAPVYEMLEQYRLKGNISYHVPGHKNGQAYSGAEWAGFLGEIMRYDVTEITGSDDLHHPEGVIKEAQELAAACFGADESYFLVGGSTVGNLALILTVCPEPGMTIIVQRNSHKSIIHGLMLAGARAVFLEPQLDPQSGLAVAPAAKAVQAALGAYPEAAAVLITMPNYYGMGSDLAPLAQACHDSGVPLLVDEAHGAHYGMHLAFPAGALSCGADGVVQSTHKMLPALTMGAMLHVQGPLLDRALLRQRLAMVQSSSPSYPLMASLDLARRLVHVRREEAFTAGLAAVDVLQRGLAELPRFGLLQPAVPLQPSGGAGAAAADTAPPDTAAAYGTQDPFKAVIYDAAGVLGGFELQRRLEERGIVPEMSDARHVVLAFSLGSQAEEAARLVNALQEIAAEAPPVEVPPAIRTADTAGAPSAAQQGLADDGPQALSELGGDSGIVISTWNNFNSLSFSEPVRFSMKPVRSSETQSVALEYSVGRAAAEMVIPYPPGIPLLYPGEIITGAILQRLTGLREGGAKFQACTDPALQHILVYHTEKGGEV
ncbi:aminotransferase class I/II-fold pyridoxal phosphate-dependent enzyme [Paenibacillus tengchongensis]|uniref:aminotransferase class I/II-fold pyridoxal phosphate-dependent enzyme n=1 Tax=Paenibacillus tengchongensis TaxID=2608684 RepID=UPI00124F014D|nr:aminotransferase class I/II-fold pyridoxal phosphate-dependent enzyme [Paenibacillus tengchongensis]